MAKRTYDKLFKAAYDGEHAMNAVRDAAARLKKFDVDKRAGDASIEDRLGMSASRVALERKRAGSMYDKAMRRLRQVLKKIDAQDAIVRGRFAKGSKHVAGAIGPQGRVVHTGHRGRPKGTHIVNGRLVYPTALLKRFTKPAEAKRKQA